MLELVMLVKSGNTIYRLILLTQLMTIFSLIAKEKRLLPLQEEKLLIQ